ncbi:hydantoinase B/oxoprolinase family protein [Synechococcus sp. PCC 6312]|uniref:hydantoinase B/oxoprolinase family protein n=1 Tax=Synechococcus sp. (strain ATCC 27167 / PCC 6312) TaxID=195253 RepID=UPI00029F0A28|nr:hydantoinase B/oxoprolinase family protein [Synechococcus sp. PCC 6312]AFY62558.1 N-methylhydantoinase A/acetone carboxylase, beta subunit [Synechococcus sp. PCC 6312]
MGWQFWIDRGGTFTDIVAQAPDGQITVHKLLSENPQRYPDAALQGIREILGIASDQPIPSNHITAVKMGTTVATNALLEHKGEPTVLVINSGFKDALRIGYQNRPDLFALEIKLPKLLYADVIEVCGRYQANGTELTPLDTSQIKQGLQAAFEQGIQACAIVLMHSYRYHHHEQVIAEIATEIGFKQISVSHRISPLIKLIRRGDTTVVDAYLSPILRRYVDRLGQELPPEKLLFMQSHGGLVSATQFQGKDSILSGPAGGLVGVVQTGLQAGIKHIIGFDMGGTSTDVCHYRHGDENTVIPVYERQWETEIAGVRLQTPMLAIHTVAAGGGSILKYDQGRYQVGPESAGANPGPAAYGNNGPLTITDANVFLGKIQPQFFPKIFGPNGNLPLDLAAVETQFKHLTEQIKTTTQATITPAEVAAGFITIAVETMAQAIKKISLQRGYDLRDYTLCCFGGAGGQHACLIAESLGISHVLIHPYAGVLSAYGMGLADVRAIKEQSVLLAIELDNHSQNQTLENIETQLKHAAIQELSTEEIQPERITTRTTLQCRYQGSDTSLEIPYSGDLRTIIPTFTQAHHQRYGFTFTDRPVEIASLAVEAIGVMPLPQDSFKNQSQTDIKPVADVDLYSKGQWYQVQAWQRENLAPKTVITGPALIIEPTGTNVIEVGWQATVTPQRNLIFSQQHDQPQKINSNQVDTTQNSHLKPDPIQLEIFHNLFQAIAEQMGITLQNTSASVNIKERLDFSCALFDAQGELVANAPHIPVHLGSMGQTVKMLLETRGSQLRPGQVYASNNPYAGGTHLPDITVITPVFIPNNQAQTLNDPPLSSDIPPQSSDIAPQSSDIAPQNSNDAALNPNVGLLNPNDGALNSNVGLPNPKDTALNPAQPQFFVASRGHHADIGGITPGSMPADSHHLDQEGVLLDFFQLVDHGEFQEQALLNLLTNCPYPARNPQQNITDLQAQIAANNWGVQELTKLIETYGLETVSNYMEFIQANAADCLRHRLKTLNSGSFTYPLDNGAIIQVNIEVNPNSETLTIDFTGTSSQDTGNLNAPLAVTKAAVLYVLRTLIPDKIPLNAGCLRPVTVIVPQGCLLNPKYPAAVVAGNVETSQAVTNAIYGALGIMAASQGTMNNLTFGNSTYQYYETIGGGSGAGPGFHGASGVQTHMTNSRLTDPEVLETRYPVLLETFAIRADSGGQGEFTGGNGLIRRIKFLEPMTVGMISQSRIVAPFGLGNGEAGKTGENLLELADGTRRKLEGKFSLEIQANDIIEIQTPGGGSYQYGDLEIKD